MRSAKHPRTISKQQPENSWATSASEIECAFSLLQRHVLARGSFASLDQLRQRVYEYMCWFNSRNAPPFQWSYRPKSWD